MSEPTGSSVASEDTMKGPPKKAEAENVVDIVLGGAQEEEADAVTSVDSRLSAEHSCAGTNPTDSYARTPGRQGREDENAGGGGDDDEEEGEEEEDVGTNNDDDGGGGADDGADVVESDEQQQAVVADDDCAVPEGKDEDNDEEEEEEEYHPSSEESDDDDDEEDGTPGAVVVDVAPEAAAAAAMPPPPPPPQSRSDRITAAATTKPPPQSSPHPPAVPPSLRGRSAPSAAAASSSSAAASSSSAAVPLLLLTLPVDSLHCIASFLEPPDWSNLGMSSRGANLACKEVFRRVRMHGFRCATEVVTAWARGEHADARELSALYIKSGVPIYPLCLGHSYQTLTWRMGVEAREMDVTTGGSGGDGQSSDSGEEGNNNETTAGENPAADSSNADDGAGATSSSGSGTSQSKVKLDRFYTERYEARSRDGYYYPTMTYLEEKCMFWKYRAAEKDGLNIGSIDALSPERRHSLTHGVSLRPPPVQMPGNNNNDHHHNHAAQHQHHQQHPLGGPAALLPPRMAGLPGDLPPQFGGGPGPGPGGGGGGNAAAAAAQQQQQQDPPFVANAAAQAAGLTPPRRTLSSGNLLSSPYGRNPLQAPGAGSGAGGASAAAAQPRRPKMTVRTHRHLADHHLLGQRSTNDEDGTMKAGGISLSVDFFHPHLIRTSCASSATAAAVYPADYVAQQPSLPMSASATFASPGLAGAGAGAGSNTPLGGPHGVQYQPPGYAHPHAFGAAAAAHWLPQPGPTDAAAATAAPAIVPPDLHPQGEGAPEGVGTGGGGLVPPPAFIGRQMMPAPPTHQLQHAVSFGGVPSPAATPYSTVSGVAARENSIVTDVTLEVYSSSSSGLPKAGSAVSVHSDDPSSALGGDAGGKISLRNLRSRFSSYQRKLDSHLSHYQSPAFDECLLDFWDEFLPLTTGVHYYDGHTPVPRMSSLHRFLSSPCPKSLGIVQCEIERIKISSKKKGVNVKGRLFPSYEYRLFIRDRRHGSSESQTGPADAPPRSDTVLMTAMNKGKNHLGAAGLSPAPSSSKRGVNNYYMYMPQQKDVDNHFKSVNDPSVLKDNSDSVQPAPFQKLSPIGSSAISPLELGRLQSNFIGTEFQIFSPCIKKQHTRATAFSSSRSDSIGDDSDNEFDGESRVSGETTESLPTSSSLNPRRGSASGFRRRLSSSRRSLSRGRRGSNASVTRDADDASSLGPASTRSRRGSWPTLRPSRRAIANSIDSPPGQEDSYLPVMGEEENGAITYTANLLGNRPRIMDVCIPKVLEDNAVSPEWRRHCDSLSDRDDDKAESMMNRFKQIQQQGDNPDGGNNENPADSRTTPSEFGLMALQNRPPWWNVELGAFVLNFGGRVSVASVKNFQLCDRGDQEHIMLQFGRIQGRHSFTMDFQYPLSAMQAFAIAISSLQSKISFG